MKILFLIPATFKRFISNLYFDPFLPSLRNLFYFFADSIQESIALHREFCGNNKDEIEGKFKQMKSIECNGCDGLYALYELKRIEKESTSKNPCKSCPEEDREYRQGSMTAFDPEDLSPFRILN